MSEELKPCPFCGNGGLVNEYNTGGIDLEGWRDEKGNYGPACMKCGAMAPSYEVWQTRTPNKNDEGVDHE